MFEKSAKLQCTLKCEGCCSWSPARRHVSSRTPEAVPDARSYRTAAASQDLTEKRTILKSGVELCTSNDPKAKIPSKTVMKAQSTAVPSNSRGSCNLIGYN